jgi:hypothetical protein
LITVRSTAPSEAVHFIEKSIPLDFPELKNYLLRLRNIHGGFAFLAQREIVGKHPLHPV